MFNPNINYTTFICYRRKEYGDTERPIGSYVARIIYEYLSKKGFLYVMMWKVFHLDGIIKKQRLNF